MDAKTRKALEGSITKWAKIVTGNGQDNGCDNCPLCRRFADIEFCGGCPVARYTGESSCYGSPYTEWQRAFEKESKELTGAFYYSDARLVIGPRTQAVAIAEHDFLVSLLPENNK